ncbi:MAG: hypothetical protein M1416_00150 [Candidatus Pacearchaeota archaeon]|nr:hypothetical protein [Candidatus Pacearchaeota archaeon]
MRKIVDMVDFPYIVKEKKKELFDYILYCCNEEKNACFRLKVSSVVYERIKLDKLYVLRNEPIFQNFDSKGNPAGKPFMKLSNF